MKGVFSLVDPKESVAPLSFGDAGVSWNAVYDGIVTAVSQNGWDSIDVSGIGRFRCAREGFEVEVEPRDDLDRVREIFDRLVTPLLLQARGYEVLHASAVRTSKGVVGLCGDMRAGKSTLARALVCANFGPWADDTLVFSTPKNAFYSLPLPNVCRLRPDTAVWFPPSPSTDDHALPTQEEPLAALVFLHRDPGLHRSRMDPTEPRAAFRKLLAHACAFSLTDRARNAAMVQTYLDLATRVPTADLILTEGLGRLHEAVELFTEEFGSFLPPQETVSHSPLFGPAELG